MTTNRPEKSRHADFRQIQYADVDADPDTMWRGGLPLIDHGLHADEARYDPKYAVVLVRKNGGVTTMIDFNDSTRPETIDAVARAIEFYGDQRLDRS